MTLKNPSRTTTRQVLHIPSHPLLHPAMRRVARELAVGALARPQCVRFPGGSLTIGGVNPFPRLGRNVGGGRISDGHLFSKGFVTSSVRFASAGESSVAGLASFNPPRFATLIASAVFGFTGTALLTDAQCSEAQFFFFSKVSPLFRLMDAETAHNLGIFFLQLGIGPLETRPDPVSLSTTLWDVTFANPIGLAAGFDKDAKAFPALLRAGFGFVEIGSVTPLPQPGNPKPRVFRLAEHGAVINRYGFNSEGHGPAGKRLGAYREKRPTQFDVKRKQSQQSQTDQSPAPGQPCSTNQHTPPLGVNLGKNKLTPELEAYLDYTKGVKELGKHADYLVRIARFPNPGTLFRPITGDCLCILKTQD